MKLLMSLASAALIALTPASFAQSTAFTYQGQLKSGVSLAEGQHDFRFRLYDAASGGTQLGTTQCVDNIPVRDGVFTTTIDFGNQFATPNSRFIEIDVRRDTGLNCSNTTGYTTLAPRQPITPAPTATQAASAFSLAAPDGSPAKAVFVDNDGKVGIGTTTPTHTVHVASPGPTLALQDTNAASQQAGYVSYRDNANIERAWVGFGTPGSPDFSIINTRPSGDIVLNAAGGGNVGIGTNSPTHSVHIASPAPTLAIQDTDSTTQQVGYVSYRDSGNVERAWVGYGSAGDPDFSIVNARAGGDIVLNAFGGRVGIGTTSPTTELHVVGSSRYDVNTYSDNLRIVNVNGDQIWSMGVQALGSPPNPALGLYSPISGDVQAGMHRSIDGGVGEVYADRKNFRVPNPADLTTDIWYCCPEGPEAAMYVRGTGRLVNGRAIIELPDHFRSLASQQGMTVQLTPRSLSSRGLAYSRASLNGIEVGELFDGTGNYEFDWRVEAVRKGHEAYQVIRPWMRSVPDETKAWQNRLNWIKELRASGRP